MLHIFYSKQVLSLVTFNLSHDRYQFVPRPNCFTFPSVTTVPPNPGSLIVCTQCPSQQIFFFKLQKVSYDLFIYLKHFLYTGKSLGKTVYKCEFSRDQKCFIGIIHLISALTLFAILVSFFCHMAMKELLPEEQQQLSYQASQIKETNNYIPCCTLFMPVKISHVHQKLLFNF